MRSFGEVCSLVATRRLWVLTPVRWYEGVHQEGADEGGMKQYLTTQKIEDPKQRLGTAKCHSVTRQMRMPGPTLRRGHRGIARPRLEGRGPWSTRLNPRVLRLWYNAP